MKNGYHNIINSNANGNIKNIDDIKNILLSITELPPSTEEPDLYQDYGNDVKFTAKTAKGECAA